MKQIFLISFFSLVSLFIYGQNPANNQAMIPGIYLSDGSKLNEYKKTFEIKNVPNPDNATLSKIDASKYWKYTNKTQRAEVLETVTGLTLILYSHNEINALIDFNTALIVMPLDFIKSETKTAP